MCDLGSIAGVTSGRTDLGGAMPWKTGRTELGDAMPWLDKESEFSTGELLKSAGGVFSAFGGASEADDLAAQREQRAGQILEATKQTIALKSLQQGRAMGQTRAAIGKAGVGASGSAAVLLENQGRLDEMALESAKQRGVLQIDAELTEASNAQAQSRVGYAKAISAAGEFAGNLKGFDLG